MSRLLRQSLMPDEKVVRIGRFHFIYTLSSLVIFAAFAGAGYGLQQLVDRFALLPEGLYAGPVEARRVPLMTGIGLGGFVFLWRWLVKSTTEIVLTNKRFLFKRGIFSVRTEKLNVREVNYCEIRQSFLGNLLDYGKVFVYTLTLDDNNILLPEIAKPHVFTSMIEQVKKGMAPVPQQQMPPEAMKAQAQE